MPRSQHQIGAQSGAQSDKILFLLKKEDLFFNQLSQGLGLQSKTGAFKRTLQELLEKGLIEYTIPEKKTVV